MVAGEDAASITLTSPSVLVVASPDRQAAARAAVALSGARLVDVHASDQASDHSDHDAILVWVDGEAAIVEAVAAIAPDVRGIVATRFAEVDQVWALVDGRPLTIACDPDEVEVAALLAEAIAPDDPRVRDPGEDGALVALELRRLSGEIVRIARALDELADRPAPADAAALPSAAAIRSVIRARRLRDQYFAAGLFADPAWDILLDLMAARVERRRISVSSLCIASAVPPTTALRWIAAMTTAGLLERSADPADARRAFVGLSDGATSKVAAYFAALAAQGLPGG